MINLRPFFVVAFAACLLLSALQFTSSQPDKHNNQLRHQSSKQALIATLGKDSVEFKKAIDEIKDRKLDREARKSGRRKIKIYMYDDIQGYLNWIFPWFKDGAVRKCDTICTFVINEPSELPNADVVMFHAPTHMKRDSPMKIDTIRTPSHILFTMISLEQPNYAKVLSNTDYLEKHMDLLLTYSRKSKFPGTNVANLPISYFPLNLVDTKAVLQPSRPFRQKTGYGTGVMVAVFTSNCKAAGAEERYKYLEELMTHIEVHSYGGCLNNRKEPSIAEDGRWPPVAQRRARKIKILSYYKFYLAFENLAVEDYVSEKVFEGYFSGSLPVYRGTNTIGHFVPDNSSFIDANGMSPKALAALMKSIGSNEEQYNKFFEYKKRPLTPEFENVALRSYTHPNVLCRLCDVADVVKQAREQEGK